MSKIFLVGLGNPGEKYRGTRHNIGFDVVERFAALHGLSFRVKGRVAPCEIAEGSVLGHNLVVVKPLTFMNRSGEALAPLARYYRAAPGDVLVVHDDLDLPLGRLRFARSGGHGGHKGVRSIIEHLSSRDFPRLRVGIGRPDGPLPVDRYVLSGFAEDQKGLAGRVIDISCEALRCYLEEGMETAMNRYNGLVIAPA